jgi:hypothetical protein
MKISKGYVKTAFEVTEKATGRKYDCFIQDYEYVSSGKHETRFNIGINGWNEGSFKCYESEDDFNRYYAVE